MEYHQGRLLDHVHLIVRDIGRSKRFDRAVLDALSVPLTAEGDDWFAADELFVSQGDASTARLHLAFQAADRTTVKRFHEAALAAGGRDNGGPGERHYHPGDYAAFVFDPDGGNCPSVRLRPGAVPHPAPSPWRAQRRPQAPRWA